MADSSCMITLWSLPDDLWERVEWLLKEYDPPKPTGRRRAPARPILDGLIYHFRTGCQWNHIPQEYGDDATIHRTFQRWVRLGLFEMIWSLLLAECDVLGLVDWRWQAADGALGKARSGGDQIGPNPTDRGKQGSKKVCWSRLRAGHWPSSSPRPRSTTTCCWPRRSRRSWSSAQSRPRPSRSTSAWTPARITSRAGKLSKSMATVATSAPPVESSQVARAAKNAGRAAGWWSGRSGGSRNAAACRCAMRSKVRITSACCSWRARCIGTAGCPPRGPAHRNNHL
jgi:transposase